MSLVVLLLLLAQFAARALALVGRRRFARVARRGTLENLALRAFVRRLHARGMFRDASLLTVMKQLCLAVAAVAHFQEQRGGGRWRAPLVAPARLDIAVLTAVALTAAWAPPPAPADTS